ncbi:MAG: 3-dehydroquinate synthase II [Armatimonadota bacterium]
MKSVWVKVIPWRKDLVTAALESGADAVLVEEGRTADVKALGLIQTVAPDGDFVLGRDVVEAEIAGREDEMRAVELARAKTVIVRTLDWTVIPLENLVAQAGCLVAQVSNAEEARVAVGVLERGVDGVLLVSDDPAEIRHTVEAVKTESERIDLQVATIVEVRPLGMGDRVCVDTCSNMGIGEGMMVGNSSAGLFLVHAESVENPYVEPRPFRVNAGAVHAYVRVPGGKTRYLSELRAGDEALIVGADGNTRVTNVGRAKVERRPLALVAAECAGETLSVVLQNAETIRLTSPDGEPVSIVALQPGTEVLVAIEKAGRHFGLAVQETVQER